jgi:hypothetical protein
MSTPPRHRPLALKLLIGALIFQGLAWRPAAAWLERLNPAKAYHWSWSGALVFGVSLMAWIVVQVALIGATSWLQPFIFSLGVIIAGLPLLPSVRATLAARM